MLSLDGLSIGDAFGDQFFIPGEEARIAQRLTLKSPWLYTDDTEMALAIVDVLREIGTIDEDLLALRFGERYDKNPNRGYGGTAHRILRAISAGSPWQKISPAVFEGQGSMGNGGGMRAGPLGAYFAAEEPAVIVAEAERSARVTHMHIEGQAGAIAVALAAAWAWKHRTDAATHKWHTGMLEFVVDHTPDSLTRAGVERALNFQPHCSLITAAAMLGNGARVTAPDTIPFSLWCASHFLHDYEEAVWQTVSALGDRDTTCAIVGSIIALAAPQTIPESWRQARECLPDFTVS